MSNTYLDFITDEDLMKCIKKFHNEYLNLKKEKTISDFYKNKVDPIRFYFDKAFNNIDEKAIINNEIIRQNDKTIGTAIGVFHEELLGCIEGYTKMPVGNEYDIKKDDESLFAEIKNKYNTLKGENNKDMHKKLKDIAEKHPKATCYIVHIIAEKSYNEVWKFKSGDKIYEHTRVREISADRFYNLLTGNKDSFAKLCKVLPAAIAHYLESNKAHEINEEDKCNMGVYSELKERADKNKIDILKQIYIDTFDDYLGVGNNKYTLVDIFPGSGCKTVALESLGFKPICIVTSNEDEYKIIKKNRPKWKNIKVEDSKDLENQCKLYVPRDISIDLLSITAFKGCSNIIKQINSDVIIVECKADSDVGEIKKELDNIDYNIEHKVLNAAYFNVAQETESSIILGTRKCLDNNIEFPKENKNKCTLKEILKDFKGTNLFNYNKEEKELLTLLKEGKKWNELEAKQVKKYNEEDYNRAKILSWNEPCKRLIDIEPKKQIDMCHPEDIRPFSIEEFSKIQGFPIEWEFFKNSKTKTYNQIINTMPYELAKSLGQSIVKYIDDMRKKDN